MKDTVTVRAAIENLDDLVRQVEQGNGPIWLARGRSRKVVLVDARMFESLVTALEDLEDRQALVQSRRAPAGSTLPMPAHARPTKTL